MILTYFKTIKMKTQLELMLEELINKTSEETTKQPIDYEMDKRKG